MIIHRSKLADLRDDVRGASIALRFGSYDLLHAGHQAGIDHAAAQADILVLGVMSDDYIQRVKGPERPVNPEVARIERIDEAEGVDYSFVAPANNLAVARLFLKLLPDVYVQGQEHPKSQLKTSLLGVLGVRYVVDQQPRIASTSQMIDCLGLEEAKAHSNLEFRFDHA